MEFFEQGDFTNFDEEEEEQDTLKCFQCKEEFKVPADEAPKKCPACGIVFLPEGST